MDFQLRLKADRRQRPDRPSAWRIGRRRTDPVVTSAALTESESDSRIQYQVPGCLVAASVAVADLE